MSTIEHNEMNDPALLVQRYQLGLMTPDEEVAFENAVAKSPEIREELAAANESLTALYEDLSKAISAPRKDVKKNILAKIGVSSASIYDVDEFVLKSEDAKWVKTNIQGIEFKILYKDEDDRTMLIARLAPGTVFPPHQRLSTEECYVLSGDFWADGQKLVGGDFIAGKAGEEPSPVYSEGGCELLLKLLLPPEISVQ